MKLPFALYLLAPLALPAQSASFAYRLGKDTVALEQYTRTNTQITGDMVQRNGPTVSRVQYRIALGKDGRPVAAAITRLNGDGTPASAGPRRVEFTFTADSMIRETVFADSTQRRAFAARQGFVNFPTFVYGPTEALHALGTGIGDSVVALGAAGTPGFTGLTAMGGDSTRLRGGAYAMVLRFDKSHRLLSVDGRNTTNKVVAERGNGGLDFNAMAKAMRPTGVLSGREDVRAAFGPGGMVVVDYGRPQVRERSVWGGTLVPFDSVWRAGANDATHLFTTRTLTFGSLTLPPGMYTLWVQHRRDGTSLIINKQTGQWGTQYDAAQDLGRVAMTLAAIPEHVEELTYTLRATGPTKGLLTIAWEKQAASVEFGVSAR